MSRRLATLAFLPIGVVLLATTGGRYRVEAFSTSSRSVVPSCWSGTTELGRFINHDAHPRSAVTRDSIRSLSMVSLPGNEQEERDNKSLVTLENDNDNNNQSLMPPSQHHHHRSPHESIDWIDDSKHVELVGLITWMSVVSVFILINNFMGPWPQFLSHVPERLWFLGHMVGGVLFGGGVVLTTAVEWLVVQNRNPAVLQFWFDKVPLLDMALVLPGLTLSMVSGTGLSIVRYGGLALAPPHIQYAFWALVSFAVWWAVTDLTTQGSALNAVLDLSPDDYDDDFDDNKNTKIQNAVVNVPDEVSNRLVSNLVSCVMVFVMYGIMVMKPGTLHHW